ncbi:GNAT family N-acetyltransferase [Fertoebacter nigrum]|uniref:GNAT family N-acetyltransferase n=1 Tax=Fertoeibacter niger TaxID=2656921 RepID=A0A8X8KR00_9RHOB|nr:GNAT family N-acetyltransferase [Fertoeibacter niger]NUB44647.1 GNAT family N-acetyltransferase [Fertoeibacter niger]
MTPRELEAVLEATWPPAATCRAGPWLIRDGLGGGKRVSAATAAADWQVADIATAEAAQAALGQPALFMIRPGEDALDAALAAQGYRVVDPVLAYAAPVVSLAHPAPDPTAGFAHWPPLGITADIWASCGTDAARLRVMDRATGPKCVILGRHNDRVAGVAFAAIHGATAMLHALEVLPAQRRQGSAHSMLRCAAIWAQDHGATQLSLVVTAANTGARALYASLNMQIVGQYHYRMK